MAKKILILIIVLLVVLGGFGLLQAYKTRRAAPVSRSPQKAAEVTLRFIEGWNARQIAAYLNYDQDRTQLPHILNEADFLAAQQKFDTTNYPLLAGKPKTAGLEGFLFPDSYRFYESALNPASSSPEQISNLIIKKMLDNFSQKFTSEMQVQATKQNLSIYKIITLASIIEKETGASLTEKKIIAGIFYNRLKVGMPLQSDATVNYVTKKNEAMPSEADTKTDSPYNTYKYAGLPPGPIANPSLNAIIAALYPSESDYMYFLHDQKTGQAIYAKTFDEHIKNKFKYLK